jgi:1,2-phenylacetyl-CoA epoxidase catalytic subunit
VAPELEQLFARIAKDERFHVQYSRHWLSRLEPRRAGDDPEPSPTA